MKYTHDQRMCEMRLKDIGRVLGLYSNDSDGKYPTPDKWCDLLSAYADQNRISTVLNFWRAREVECWYAINPHAKPDSPADTVLLFDIEKGWNRAGGPELFSTVHHRRKGINVLFNNGTVKFVPTNDLTALKWKDN
jgi:hypothetical protein